MKTLHTAVESTRAFTLVLAAVILLPIFAVRYQLAGDVAEYTLMTIAIANHGTPEIRMSDIDEGNRVLPEMSYAYNDLAQGIEARKKQLRNGFNRDLHGNVQAIHFFAYSALAAVPYKILTVLGLPAMKCYQFVNGALLFVLGLSLRRFFGNGLHAVGGLALFLLCGGLPYANWSSPEFVSASALLAGMLLTASAAPLAGGILIGLAATQNPSIVLVLGMIPVIVLCRYWRRGMNANDAWNHVWHAPVVGGLAAGAALFATNPLFNLYAFGVPSIIAVGYTLPELASWTRLHSVFFDLNQGMMLAIPAAGVLVFWLALRGATVRARVLLLCAVLAILGMTMPALVVTNWNSGAAGVMRYSFWSAMPLLFVLLWQLRERERIAPKAVIAVLLIQALATVHMLSYGYTIFSPLSRAVMRVAPQLYNPDPEIFYERALQAELSVGTDDIVQYTDRNVVRKTIYNISNQKVEERLCGKGYLLANDNSITTTTQHWRYINGPVRCVSVPGYKELRFSAAQFGPGGILVDGWSPPQFGAKQWTGTWSDSAVSHIRIPVTTAVQPRRLFITGFYHEKAVHKTRVTINGKDYGWVKLDQNTLPFPIPQASQFIDVTLEHDPYVPPANEPDQRRFALFLQEITAQ